MRNKVIVFLIITVTVFSMVLSCAGFNIGSLIRTAAQPGVFESIMSALEEITPEQEYYIGRAVAANILSTNRLYNGNAALTNYLNRICMAIAINSPRPDIYNGYHVAILDSDEVNAFATPGGHIFVTRGLINTARSEDALAAVIAHEMAHIQLQHGLKAIKSSRFANAVAVTGSAAVGTQTSGLLGELTGALTETVGDIVQTMVNNGYSQTQEYEADATAMLLLASAGYNPASLIEMLQALPTSGNAGFSRTHPQPSQRITRAQRLINRYPVIDTTSYRTARFTAATR